MDSWKARVIAGVVLLCLVPMLSIGQTNRAATPGRVF